MTNKTAQIAPFHPPLPSPIIDQPVDIVVITPEVTAEWNADQKRYVYMGFSQADYLTFAAWIQDVLRHVRQQRQVIDYYRNFGSEAEQ